MSIIQYMNRIKFIQEWIRKRFLERTTWDGIVIITASMLFLLVKPIAGFIAYAAIAYGIWTILKYGSNK